MPYETIDSFWDRREDEIGMRTFGRDSSAQKAVESGIEGADEKYPESEIGRVLDAQRRRNIQSIFGAGR